MQNSAIYDPRAKSTPSQRLEAAAHAERRRKIAERAKVDAGICLRPMRPALAEIDPAAPDDQATLLAEWAERQKQIPIPRAPWFSIVSESELLDSECLPRKPAIGEIIYRVARFYRISVNDIKSARRLIHIVRPRQVAMFLAKELTIRSLPEIGRAFGGRDHTTVLHAVRKIGELIKRDAGIASDVDAVRASIIGE